MENGLLGGIFTGIRENFVRRRASALATFQILGMLRFA